MKRPSLTAQVYVALDALHESKRFSVPKDSTKRVMRVLLREHPAFLMAGHSLDGSGLGAGARA